MAPKGGLLIGPDEWEFLMPRLGRFVTFGEGVGDNRGPLAIAREGRGVGTDTDITKGGGEGGEGWI